MEIINKTLDQIMPYERNPRNNDEAINKVANSIKEFGFKVPIVIDAAGVIVCGHTRYKAAQQLGLDSVPCIMADDLTPYQIQAFRLADNKVSEFSGWDFSLLESELAELGDMFKMSDFGFDEESGYSYLDDLLNEEFAKDPNLNKNDSFNITFTFPIEQKDCLQNYLKDNGKEQIVDLIIKEAQSWEG